MTTVYEWRNPVRNPDGVTFNCEVNHPDFGWVPFTASPEDPVEYGRIIHAQIAALDYVPDASPRPSFEEPEDGSNEAEGTSEIASEPPTGDTPTDE